MTPELKLRLIAIYGVLAALNVGAWIWAAAAFHASLVPLALSLMVYGLGLRHAVDADHIAAIDNMTRKLMHQGQRPVSVGFFFALGHSTVVILVTAAVAAAATLLGGFRRWQAIGGTIGTAGSVLFLFAIAAMNIIIFAAIHRNYRQVRAGVAAAEAELDPVLAQRGLLARLFRPAFRLIGRSWHMFPLGFLFGLGFDTATEVAVFGLSAAQAANGASVAAILVLPVLFAAGMALVDTTDGVMMLGAYGWAFAEPMRKLRYNMTITLVSAAVALAVGGGEALGLIGGKFGFDGGRWQTLEIAYGDSTSLGVVIIGVFLLAWALSYAIYRLRRLDAAGAGAAR